VTSQVGFHFATLFSPAGRDQNPVSTVRPFRSLYSLFSLSPIILSPRATSSEGHPTRSPLRGVMPTSSGSYARKTGLRSHGPVDEQPSAFVGPVQPIPSRLQQSGDPTSPTVPSESSGFGPEPLPMTILPAPTLRGAPDATQKATPQGDHLALQSAPEITLAELVEDLAHNLQYAGCRGKMLTWLHKILLPGQPVSVRKISTCVRSWQIWSLSS
jgi:hypothetical protein